MVTGKWKTYPIHLTPTEETALTASDMDAREKRLTIVGFDSDKTDNTVEVLCANDMVYSMSTSLFQEIQHLTQLLNVDAHLTGTHITQCTVAEEDDEAADYLMIKLCGLQISTEINPMAY